jgi:hypothetical protein
MSASRKIQDGVACEKRIGSTHLKLALMGALAPRHLRRIFPQHARVETLHLNKSDRLGDWI